MGKELIGRYVDVTRPIRPELCGTPTYKKYEDSIKKELRSIGEIPVETLLSNIESTDTSVREKSLNQLILQSQQLIGKCASLYATPDNFVDYILEGNIVLKNAMANYSTDKGSYVAYASRCLINHFINNVANYNDLVVDKRTTYYPILEKIKDDFFAINNREMSDIELGDAIDKLKKKGKKITGYVQRCRDYTNLDDSIVGENNLISEENLKVVDVVSYNVYQDTQNSNTEIINNLLNDTKEYIKNSNIDNKKEMFDNIEILSKYHGIGQYGSYSLTSLCDEYKMSIRELHKRLDASVNLIKKVHNI